LRPMTLSIASSAVPRSCANCGPRPTVRPLVPRLAPPPQPAPAPQRNSYRHRGHIVIPNPVPLRGEGSAFSSLLGAASFAVFAKDAGFFLTSLLPYFVASP